MGANAYHAKALFLACVGCFALANIHEPMHASECETTLHARHEEHWAHGKK